MHYSFHPDAEKELDEAIAYYNGCQKGLGLEFAKEVYLAIQNILSFPHAKSAMAEKMHTSRPALDRLLDPTNVSITLQTLESAALVLGRTLKLSWPNKALNRTCKKAAADNFNIVVAVGGDGSVNETAKGLIGSNTAMAIIPAGSGSGLARHLNIPLDIKKALGLINNGTETKVDTIQLNEQTFVNVAGVGFDAHIGWEFSKFGYKLFRKTLHESSHLEILKAKEVIVKQTGTIAHIDGEPIEVGNTILIKVNP